MAGSNTGSSSGMAGPNYGSEQQLQQNMTSCAYSHEVVAEFGLPLQSAQAEAQPQPPVQLDAHDNFLYSQFQNPDHAHYLVIQARKQRLKERAVSVKRESALKAAAAEAQREAAKAAKVQANNEHPRSVESSTGNEPVLYKLGKDLSMSDADFMENLLFLTNAQVAIKFGVSTIEVTSRKRLTLKRESKRRDVPEGELSRDFDGVRVTNGTLTAKEAARNQRLREAWATPTECQDVAVSGTDSEQSVDVGTTDCDSGEAAPEDVEQRTLGGFRPLPMYPTSQEIRERMTVGAILNDDEMEID